MPPAPAPPLPPPCSCSIHDARCACTWTKQQLAQHGAWKALLTLPCCAALCCASRFLGVGSSNRKNQWQARILYHGKVTHLGYYRTEEEAARVYDKVSISLHGAGAQTNFPIDQV